MGRKRNGYQKRKNFNIFKNLKKETIQGILAVLLFVVALFLFLASVDKAGLVGDKTFGILGSFLGIGYYLLPIVLVALGVVFTIRRDEEKSVAIVQAVAAGVLFLSGLGLIELGFDSRGGFLGSVVARPLVALFDVTVTTIILAGLVLASVLAMFDAALRLHFVGTFVLGLFKKKEKKVEADVPVKISPESKDALLAAENKKEEKDGSEEELKVSVPEERSEFFGKKDKKMAGFRFATQKPYTPPPLDLLEGDKGKPGVGDIKANSNIIKRTLQNFGIDVEMDEVSIGPSVTRYALKPAEGVKLAKIVALQNDLALALAAHPIRIEAPIPGKSLVGIEIPNSVKTTVGLGTLLGSPDFTGSEKPLLLALGKGVSGRSHFGNMAKMPHMLIAGATGSGKSVSIHAIITSLLYRNSPENLKFIMIDPKRVELTLYNNIPHLLTPVITDPKKAILSLKWAAKEMDRRYDILETEHVRDIESYHKNILAPALEKISKKENMEDVESPETMPYVVIIIDELADIMQTFPRELEAAIVRLAQMSRAVGIHLILSTQRPSVNVITGLIKANIPTRIALQVTSQVDSRTILDAAGAEKLLGAGDMLYQSSDMSKPQRIQSAFISEKEVKGVVNFLKDQYKDEIRQELDITGEKNGNSNAIFDSMDDEGGDDDELYEEAKVIVMQAGKASTSYLQRKLRVGYARAARLIDMLEERGVVGSGSGAKPRDVLIRTEDNSQVTEES